MTVQSIKEMDEFKVLDKKVQDQIKVAEAARKAAEDYLKEYGKNSIELELNSAFECGKVLKYNNDVKEFLRKCIVAYSIHYQIDLASIINQ